MNQRRKIELKEAIAARARNTADPALRSFADASRALSSDVEFAAFAERVLRTVIPTALQQLKNKMTAVLARIDAEVERKDRERTLLARRSTDELMRQIDEAWQMAIEILRRLMPEAALAHLNIEFADSVALPISHHLRDAIEQSEKAQKKLVLHCNSQVREVCDSLYVEILYAISAADKQLGGGALRKPQAISFRPPEFFFIDFYAVIDRYEQTRVVTQGTSQVHAIKPKWFSDLLLRLPRFAGMDLGEIIGGVSAFDSLTMAKRAQLRRDLSTYGAEQRRRTMATALEQIGTYLRELKASILAQSRTHYWDAYDTMTARLAELARERRNTIDSWASVERPLREAEGMARELIALTASAMKEAACIA